MTFTAYRDIDDVLVDLLSGVRAVLGSQFTGLYVSGSLAAGDFHPASSDLDFVVVTEGQLAPVTVDALAALHRQLVAGAHSRWAGELEGSYIPQAALRVYDPDNATHPQVERGGILRVGHHGIDWVILHHVLREHGLTLAGPPVQTLIDPVSPAAIRQAARATLASWWQPMLADPARLESPIYASYAILTMCRILYTLRHATVVSKPVAARWAMEMLGAPWDALVAKTLETRDAPPPGQAEQARSFIRFACEYSGKAPSSTSGEVAG